MAFYPTWVVRHSGTGEPPPADIAGRDSVNVGLRDNAQRYGQGKWRICALRRRWENVDGYRIGHKRFDRLRHADGSSWWLRTRIVGRRKVQKYAHRGVPQDE